jgi:hypothetical protein
MNANCLGHCDTSLSIRAAQITTLDSKPENVNPAQPWRHQKLLTDGQYRAFAVAEQGTAC